MSLQCSLDYYDWHNPLQPFLKQRNYTMGSRSGLGDTLEGLLLYTGLQ